ncbi:uncharacterized protein LOC117101206 [Anneissia japonica]|uniref:uncharacterized protein LOC117101206 n=1 Tax=Anneissia japonica TaxID=1529436 RepID=UPI001425B0B7|nr:uncharacterized protein LOC117101206 [Anneissia japonica]
MACNYVLWFILQHTTCRFGRSRMMIMRVRIITVGFLGVMIIWCLLRLLFSFGEEVLNIDSNFAIPALPIIFPHAKEKDSVLSSQNIRFEKIKTVENSHLLKAHDETGNIINGQRNNMLRTPVSLELLLNKRLPWMRLERYLPNYFTKTFDDVERAKYQQTTLAYLYSPRSASSTSKLCLRKAASAVGRNIGPELTGCTRVHLKHLGEYDILIGDTAFGVCEDLAKPCAYVTMMRDPYERIVSSYLYCRRKRTNPLCRALSPWKASINEWAIHLGNYFFQQLIFHPKFCNKFHEYYYPAGFKHEFYISQPSWFRQKVILSYMITEQQKETLITYCLENLENWFAVVGITEYYDLSQNMIETVFGIPLNQSCAGISSQNVGKHSHLLIQHNENAIDDSLSFSNLIAKLKQDDSVTHAIKADLRIYARFKKIFEQQRVSMLLSN